MAAAKPQTVPVACPNCGNTQPEPPTAYSTVCKKCRTHFRVQDALKPVAKPAPVAIALRTVRCFECGTELQAPHAAASTMCKRCSSHVDLADYHIAGTVSKNFRTHGRLVIEEKGYVLNTDARVGEAVVKGRLIGKLASEGTLEILSSANIKGTFTAGRLVIPLGHHFSWPEPITVQAAEIAGELAATLRTPGTVVLRSSARLFGNIEAGSLVVEAGAVFVGNAKVGQPTPGEPPAALPAKKTGRRQT